MDSYMRESYKPDSTD